jgi:hypothetical protein
MVVKRNKLDVTKFYEQYYILTEESFEMFRVRIREHINNYLFLLKEAGGFK